MSKSASYNRPRYRPQSPHRANNAEPLPSQSEGHKVSDDNLCQSNQASTSNPLRRATHQENGKVVRDCGDDSANDKEDEPSHDHWLSSKDMREAGEAWLKDGGTQEKRGTRPESFDGGPTEFVGYQLYEQISTMDMEIQVSGIPTGSATDKEVPSSATIIVITERVKKARYNRAEGLHCCCKPFKSTPGIPATDSLRVLRDIRRTSPTS
ncbi:MAG: hypothetical protein Q9170_006948 [Blastenia crenularia]